MAASRYMNSSKNLSDILRRVQEAGAPEKFNTEFLRSTLGFSSSNDRSVVSILKNLGFISEDGVPTDRYNAFRSGMSAGHAMRDGLKEGWSDVFLSDQKAHEKTSGELKEIFKTVAGVGEKTAEKMATTFKVLAGLADWTAAESQQATSQDESDNLDTEEQTDKSTSSVSNISLRHDVHVHLPASSDPSVHRAIFKALREEMID
jgi:hypothetical protein